MNRIASLVRAQIKPQMLALFLLAGFTAFFMDPSQACAADLNASAVAILNFFKLLILIVVCVGVFSALARSNLIQAVLAVLAVAFIFYMIDPDVMRGLGESIFGTFKLK